MTTQLTYWGIWEAREGHALFWRRGDRLAALWQVNADLTVSHVEGPASSKPPMHIRRTAVNVDEWAIDPYTEEKEERSRALI